MSPKRVRLTAEAYSNNSDVRFELGDPDFL